MADPTTQDLGEFLGERQQPAWRRWAGWGLVALGVVLLILLALHFLRGAAPAGYSTAPVERGDLTTSVSATGKLAPTTQVTVGSQLSGLVTQVVVDVNDHVTKNQPLALIDPEQLDDQIRQSQAALAANLAAVNQAQATVGESRAQLARLEEVYKLSNGRVPSGTELQTGRADAARAQAALKVAEANVVASRASLAQNQTQRARAIIRSPVSGVVLARQVDPGQTVASSFNTPTLFVIAEDLSKMKLEVAIDEADVGQVKVGQSATFTVDAFPGKTFPATITRVDLGSNLTVSAATSSTSSSSSTTASAGQVVSYAADLTVANPTLELRPGMTATADITTSSKQDALLVPNSALRFKPQAASKSGSGGSITSAIVPHRRHDSDTERSATLSRGAKQTVYIAAADGTPKPVTITTGDTDGTSTEVLSGDLKAGDRVITGQLAAGSAASPSKRSGGSRRSGGAAGGGASGGAGGGGSSGG